MSGPRLKTSDEWIEWAGQSEYAEVMMGRDAFDLLVRNIQKNAREAGAADMRERAADLALDRSTANRHYGTAQAIRELPLTAPSAGVPVDETKGGGNG